jgi:spore coat polysaccharide biosynthesis protein SpsF (cytidylyltransferase family)
MDYFPSLEFTEYLSAYFLNNPQIFKVNVVRLPIVWQHSEWRLTLDEAADLEMFDVLFKGLDVGCEPLFFERLADFLKEHSDVAKINAVVPLKWKDDVELRERIKRGTSLKH